MSVVFAAFVDDPGAVVLSDEHQQFEWLAVEAAADRCTWPRSRRTIGDIVHLLGAANIHRVDDVLRVGGNEDVEVHPERGDDADHDGRQQDDRRGADVPQACGERGEDGSGRLRARLEAEGERGTGPSSAPSRPRRACAQPSPCCSPPPRRSER